MENIHSSKRFGTGIVIVLAGIILLLSNLELLPWPWRRVLVSWPMILVGVGLINFIHRQRTVGLIFTLIGVYFLLPRILHNFDWYDFWRFWPVLLIVGGLSMLWGRRGPGTKKDEVPKEAQKDVLDETTVLGNASIWSRSANFRGGEVTTVLGSCMLHLSEARLSDQGAVLDVSAVLGNVKIFVPRNWQVQIDVSNVLGSFSDKRLMGGDQPSTPGVLLIKGSCVLGGGEVLNY